MGKEANLSPESKREKPIAEKEKFLERLGEVLEGQKKQAVKEVEGVKAEGKELENILTKSEGEKSDIEEFKAGKEGIRTEAKKAESDYEEKVANITDTRRGSETENEIKIMGEVEKINDKIDEAIRKGLYEEEKKFKKERERLFDLLDGKYKDMGAKAGHIIKEIAEERPKSAVKKEVFVETDDKAPETGTMSEKTNEEIRKNLKDPDSKLSILMKSVNFREDYIAKLRKDLEKIKASKIDRQEMVKFSEKNITEHEKVLEKHKNRIREIVSELEKKSE